MYNYKLPIVLVLTINLYAGGFEQNCIKCHFQTRQLDMFMAKYTLNYSSEKRIKKAIFDYLKNPLMKNSVMPIGFLNRFGVKQRTNLDDEELKKSIEDKKASSANYPAPTLGR